MRGVPGQRPSRGLLLLALPAQCAHGGARDCMLNDVPTGTPGRREGTMQRGPARCRASRLPTVRPPHPSPASDTLPVAALLSSPAGSFASCGGVLPNPKASEAHTGPRRGWARVAGRGAGRARGGPTDAQGARRTLQRAPCGSCGLSAAGSCAPPGVRPPSRTAPAPAGRSRRPRP